MKFGWWKVDITVRVEGREVKFGDLPEYTRRRILSQINEGVVAGAFDIPTDCGKK